MSNNLKKLNIIFSGEFTYPDGMAGTKRIQHFIDYLAAENSVEVFLFRQKGNAGNALTIEGEKNNVTYRVIGANLGLSIKIPFAFFLGFKTLWKWKLKDAKNVLYLYNGITLEYIFFVLFAKIIGYKLVVEYVEDYRHSSGKIAAGLAFKMKTNVFF